MEDMEEVMEDMEEVSEEVMEVTEVDTVADSEVVEREAAGAMAVKNLRFGFRQRN